MNSLTPQKQKQKEQKEQLLLQINQNGGDGSLQSLLSGPHQGHAHPQRAETPRGVGYDCFAQIINYPWTSD